MQDWEGLAHLAEHVTLAADPLGLTAVGHGDGMQAPTCHGDRSGTAVAALGYDFLRTESLSRWVALAASGDSAVPLETSTVLRDPSPMMSIVGIALRRKRPFSVT